MQIQMLAMFSCLFCTAAIAQGSGMPDPSIGSYFYFAALDRQCPSASDDRTAALAKFKRHYFANARAVLSDPALKVPAQALEKLASMEREGPSANDLLPFTEMFAKASREELRAVCANAPRDIADRMWVEEQLAEAARKLRERTK